MCYICVGARVGTRRGDRVPGAGVPGGPELPDMDAGKRAWVL